jgi:hypothetical protein
MPPQNRSPKIDSYIAKTQPFGRPILAHLRALLHEACPGVEETIKWSQPFFVHRGAILCNMAGFKAHCHFHFWGQEISHVLREESTASFGRITTLSDLPTDEQMLKWIRQAAAFVDSGQYTSPMAAPSEEVSVQADCSSRGIQSRAAEEQESSGCI